MRRFLGQRSRCAHWPVALVSLACATLLAGCSSGNALFPHTYKLMPQARDISSQMRPTDPRELSKQALEAYFIQPGDVLLLEVTDLESDIRVPADQTVMPDGTIDLGQYGRIVVAGVTIEQIEVLVPDVIQTQEKGKTIKPLNVRLNVADSARYYVLGEVNSPGAYPLIGRETVLDAIQAAGGLSDRASDCQIILSRPTPPNSCRIVLPVCYNRIVQLGDTTTNYQIRPGDRIYVATRTCLEAIKFWQRDCPNCPDCCSCALRYGVTPAVSPFVGGQGPVQMSEPVPLPSPEAVPGVPDEEPALKSAGVRHRVATAVRGRPKSLPGGRNLMSSAPAPPAPPKEAVKPASLDSKAGSTISVAAEPIEAKSMIRR
jgi:protein involved in polysaccharide export with SLBB domain